MAQVGDDGFDDDYEGQGGDEDDEGNEVKERISQHKNRHFISLPHFI